MDDLVIVASDHMQTGLTKSSIRVRTLSDRQISTVGLCYVQYYHLGKVSRIIYINVVQRGLKWAG